MVCTELMSPPAVLETLLCNNSQTFPESIQGVDRGGVMVDPALAWPAVPVLSQPTLVKIEGAWRVLAWNAAVALGLNEMGAEPGGTPRTF